VIWLVAVAARSDDDAAWLMLQWWAAAWLLLFTGILLARRGHQVVVVDSDEDPPDGSVEDDFNWPRPGVPQGRHGHVWRARVARVLRDDAPDVLDALEASGVSHAGFNRGPGYQDDRALMARRPVVEGVLRRLVRLRPSPRAVHLAFEIPAPKPASADAWYPFPTIGPESRSRKG
jgi:hypothetical protein